jgi:thiamine biosynthesis lipoprotein
VKTHRFSHHAMATVFEVRCAHENAAYVGQAAQAAFELVDRLEQDLSLFVANSDVSRINHLQAGESTRVRPSTMECLEIAGEMCEQTLGAFDVTLGSGWERLHLAAEELTVHAREAGARLDLGGIGKGYAVDRVAELLEEWEVTRALVHGGFSSVLALDPPPESEGWALTLRAPPPGEPRELVRLSARQQAFSASGTLKGAHIVDPRTGRAAEARAVWVAVGGRESEAKGSPATRAEALSTAFMVLSREEVADVCRRFPGAEAWLVEGEALVHVAPEAPGGTLPQGLRE